MLRCGLLTVGVLALGASWVYSTTAPRVPPMPGIKVLPYSSRSFDIVFQGGERAAVVSIGEGKSLMGLYVFDQYGNCLARDDLAPPPFRRQDVAFYPDDLAVVWYPESTGAYAVEVVNFGNRLNTCELGPK